MSVSDLEASFILVDGDTRPTAHKPSSPTVLSKFDEPTVSISSARWTIAHCLGRYRQPRIRLSTHRIPQGQIPRTRTTGLQEGQEDR